MKKLSIVLGLCLTGSAIAASNTTETKQKASPLKQELSRWSAGLSSTVLQAPGRTKGTERLHGMGVELQREIKLRNGFTTNSVVNIDGAYEENTSDYTYSDGSIDEDESKSRFRQITIGQSINKKISTTVGTLSVGALVGLTEVFGEFASNYTYTDSTDSSFNSTGSDNSEYKAYGRTLGLTARLTLKNKIMPFVSYRTTDYNDSQIKFDGEDDGVNYSGTGKIQNFNIQTISMGIGYNF